MATITEYLNNKNNALPAGYNALSDSAYSDAVKKNNGGFGAGLGYLGEKTWNGLVSWAESTSDAVIGGIASLFGDYDTAKRVFANDWRNYNAADERFNPGTGWKTAGDIFQGVGYSLPSMAIMFGTGGAASALGAGATAAKLIAGTTSFVTSAVGATGNAAKEAMQTTGKLGKDEWKYALLSGATEGAVETFSDMLFGGVGGIANKLGQQMTGKVAKAVARESAFKTIGKAFLSEGGEEIIGGLLEPVWKKITINPDEEMAWSTPEKRQELLYQGFVGGMSGALMGGVGQVYSSAMAYRAGSKTLTAGKAQEVLDTAKAAVDSTSDSKVRDNIRETLDLYNKEAEKNGDNPSKRQAMLLGELEGTLTQYAFEDTVRESAIKIMQNPEAVVEAVNAWGIKDESGKPIIITAEQIRENSGKNWLKENSLLQRLAILDAAGRLMADTNTYEQALLEGQYIGTRADVANFAQKATPEQKAAVNAELGIDIEKATYEEISNAFSDYLYSGRNEQFAQRVADETELRNAPVSDAVDLDSKFALKDGETATYKTENGTVRMSARGDTVYAQDSDGKIRSTTRAEAEKFAQDNAKARDERTAYEKYDARANEEISDYKNLSEPRKVTIREILRQAEAKGVDAKTATLYARIAARTGLDVTFDEKFTEDGMFDGTNRIVVNPKGSHTRTFSKILIHELDHALTKYSGAKLQSKLIKTAFENMSEDLRLETAEKYKNFYENNTKLSLSQIIDIINDEETAAYAEQMLTDTGVWDYLLSEKPTLKQKVLSFFTGEAQAYKGTEMSKEARRWWRLYKKAFDTIATKKASIANADIISPEEQLFGRRYNLAAVSAHKTKLDKMYLDSKASVDLDTLKQRYDSIVNVWNEIGGELNSEFLEAWNKRDYKNKAFTVFKEQSGYKYNIELSSMCKKGVPLFDAIDTIVKEQVMKDLQIESIDKEQKEILYDVLKSKDYQIPCAICYVEQARQNEGVIIKEFLSGNENGKIGWNATLTRIEGMMKEAGVDYTFPTLDRSVSSEMYNPNEITMDEKTQDAFYAALKTIANEEIRKANADPSKKTKRKLISVITPASVKESLKGSLTSNLALVKTLFNDPNSRMHIDNDLLYSSFTTSNLAGYHHDLYSLFNRQRGTAGYKTKQQPIVYSGDILGRWVKNNKGGEINTRIEGGIRYQSNSDSQAYTILDQVQMFIDLSAQGQYLQMYTKVPSSLVLFGKSGAKMNASLIPMVQIYYLDEAKKIVDVEKTRKYAGLSKSGNLLFDDVEGINHNIAFMVASDPEYSKNVGCICIGYSDLHIEKMLDDPRIQQIIGYHDKSNDPKKRYRGAEYAHNYNGENEAVDKNGKTKHIGFNQFVLRAEKMFGYNENTGKANERIKTVEFNGKTYSFNDIPRLAADIYKDYCAKNNYTPAYQQFKDHDNYYKLLADFSLRDSQGNYAPHRKVEYNMPETVPVWNNGKVDTVSSKEYIKSQLKEELSVRDSIARDLADTSENGIIPQFKQRVRAMSESRSVDAMTGENVRFALREKPDPKKTIKVYKLMRLVDGKLAPLFIDTANPIELGKWYDADSPKLDYIKTLPTGVHLVNDADNTSITLDEFISQNGGKTRTTPTAEMIDYATQNGLRWISIEETERGQRRFGGENRKYWNYGVTENYKNGKTTRSVGLYSMRPGWHAGSLPTMQQIPNTDADRTFVWVEGEMPADINYQAEAERNPDKDIPDHIPTDGYYLKATNANKKAAQADKVGWYVAGAFRPNKIISYAEARNVIDEWNNAHPDAIVDYDFDRLHGKDIDPKTLKIVDVQPDTGVRFALSDASMTEKRVDYIIEDSSAGNRTDYAQKWVTSINPTDFLNMTLGLKYQNREAFDKMPGDYGTNVDQYDYTEGLKKNIRQTPYLAVNVDTGEVVGHEGRHRMRALERAGINNSAIVIEFRDSDGYIVKQKNGNGNPLTTIPSITISNQSGTGQTTVLSNIIPAMKSTKAEILSTYGQPDTGVRYALSDSDIDPEEVLKRTQGSIAREAMDGYKPTRREKLQNALLNSKIAFTNEWAGVEDFGKKVGVKNIESLVQSARNTTSRMQSAMGNVAMDYLDGDGKKTTEGFGKILEPIYAKGEAYTDAFMSYLYHYHNIDRMSLTSKSKAKLDALKTQYTALATRLKDLRTEIENKTAKKGAKTKYNALLRESKALKKQIDAFEIEENKPVFGENDEQGRTRSVTADESRATVEMLEKSHPEFKKHAEKIWKFFNNLQQYRVNTGLISEEDKAYFDEKYPHYVPTFRDNAVQGMASIKGRRNLELSKTIKTAKGSGLRIKGLEMVTGQMLQQTYKAGAVNNILNSIFDASQNEQAIDGIEVVERKKVSSKEQEDRDYEAEKPKSNQITFYRNGERVTIKVTNEIFAGFDSMQSFAGYDNPVLNALNKSMNLFKNLVTSFNPAFTIRNKARDLQDAGINTRYGKKFAETVLSGRAEREMKNNSELWKLYCASGGFASSVFNFDDNEIGKTGKRGFAKVEGFTGDNLIQKIGSGAKSVRTVIENANNVVEQTTRFAEFICAIESGKTVEQAALDAAEVTTNFGRTGKLVKHFNRTIMPFLNAAIQGSSKMVRNVMDAKSARAVGRLLFKLAFLGMLPQIFNHLLYNDDDDYKELRDNDKANNFLIKVGNDFIKIPKGRVASAMAGAVEQVWHAAKGEQTDVKGYLKNTASQITPVDNVARTIISPFMDVANNKTWYGTAIEGKQFENTAPKDRYDEATSSIAIGLGKVLNYSPKKIHYIIDQYSGVIGDFILPATTKKAERGFISGNFTIDPVSSNRLSTDFYKLYDEAQYAKTAGDETAAYQVQQLNRVKSAISEMFKQKSEIQKRTDLSDKEKLAETRTIQALINEAYRTAINDFDTYTSAIKSTEGMDEKLRGVEATRLVYGAEAAFKQYNSDVYDKMSTLAATGISYDNLYSFYFGTKDIKGDPDGKDGYKIGTKRKNIVSAINKLNVTPQQKLLLIASKGYSLVDGDVKGMTAQTEKRKLLAYINSIRGLTEDQKEALAEMCGYTYKNGRVTM